MNLTDKIVITGAAGLVGQNLVVQLEEQGYQNIVAIDKQADNLAILQQWHPQVRTVVADLAKSGPWVDNFAQASCVVMLQAQITGKKRELFIQNTLKSTEQVLQAAHHYQVPYLMHISSSVVNSKAADDYTNTKKIQEQMVGQSGLKHCVLRPTLMFGWFDSKHLGWLSRFMEKSPIFPIPGHGRYPRQPLYNKDFCKIIIHCMQSQPDGKIYDIVGNTTIDYIDIIQTIKQVKSLPTWVVPIPYTLFYLLLKVYALCSRSPPFTADQLQALTAGDYFTGVDTEKTFNLTQTPFAQAVQETFGDSRYSKIVLKRY